MALLMWMAWVLLTVCLLVFALYERRYVLMAALIVAMVTAPWQAITLWEMWAEVPDGVGIWLYIEAIVLYALATPLWLRARDKAPKRTVPAQVSGREVRQRLNAYGAKP